VIWKLVDSSLFPPIPALCCSVDFVTSPTLTKDSWDFAFSPLPESHLRTQILEQKMFANFLLP
jgi:hypothetical protein